MTHAIQAYAPSTLDDIQRTAKLLAVSGYTDAKGTADVQIAQLATKIMAGAEMGYPPFASVQGIHVIQGKPTIGANLMAAAVKAHPHYDYRVKRMDNEAVEIEFFQIDGKRESLGVESFTMDDAKAAGLTGKDNWRKFPRNMLFARCMSNGVRFRCPDVFNGNAVYVPEELGAEVDGDGNVIDVEYQAAPAAQNHALVGLPGNGGDHDVDFGTPMAFTENDLPGSLDDVDEDPALAVKPEPKAEPEPAGTLIDQITDWCAGRARTGTVASVKSYNYLAGIVDRITDGKHGAVLSHLCGYPVSKDERPGQDLVSSLIKMLAETRPQQDENGKSLKDDNGKVIYEPNPDYRADVADAIDKFAADL